MPDQMRVLKGLEREDLFTVVYEQVFTDTCRYADVVLPATTFVENYDISKGYGPISLQIVQRVIEPVGEARPNAEVFSQLAERLGIGSAEEETDTLMRIVAQLPGDLGAQLSSDGIAKPPHDGAPVQFVDVFPLTADRKVDLFPELLDRGAPAGMYGYQPDPATADYPLTLISPASEKTVSSTLGELRERAAVLQMNPDDASARGLATDDPVRMFNALGEVHCPVAVNKEIRRGTVTLPKGLWRKSTYNGFTSNALVPDSLTDLGGGACFNDARVQVASLGRH
jgi:anaerobic selenocysteine-containing dehydrogenase